MKHNPIIQCRFDVNRIKERHFHQELEMIYVMEGHINVKAGVSEFELLEDDFLLMNTVERHEWKSNADVLVAVFHIDYQMLKQLFIKEHMYFECFSNMTGKNDECEQVRHLIRRILGYYQSNEGQETVLRESLYYQLLYCMTSNFLIGSSDKDNQSKDDLELRTREILEYMMSNYQDKITLGMLSEKLFLSVPYLSKFIKQRFGMGFVKLLNNIRMEYAVDELVNTKKSIIKIAMDNGFADMSSFQKYFLELFNVPPTQYREDIKKKALKYGEEAETADVLHRVENYLIDNKIEQIENLEKTVLSLTGNAKEYRAFTKNWNRTANIGSAVELLRYDIREQLLFLKSNLGFTYVRFWNTLSPDMMIKLGKTKSEYKFSELDKAIDYIVKIGMHPHIEIEDKKHFVHSKIDYAVGGFVRPIDERVIYYVLENRTFFEELIKHWVLRYGIEEVEKWYIEFEGTALESNLYLEAFQMVSYIFKSYAPGIKIGGAGYFLCDKADALKKHLEYWKDQKIKPDFISIYCYPYIPQSIQNKEERRPYSSDSSFLYHQIDKLKKMIDEVECDVPEMIVSEWSFTLSSRNNLNDSYFKAAYTMKNLMQNWNHADSIVYWQGTDITTEEIDASEFLFGGAGIITKDNIPKPVYYAFRFLNSCKSNIVAQNDNSIITTDGKNNFIICCHNYKHFNYRYYFTDEDSINIEKQERYFEDFNSRKMHFCIKNVAPGRYLARVHRVNRIYGNVQYQWEKLHFFKELNRQDINYLRESIKPELELYEVSVDEDLVIDTLLTAQEIQSIEIVKIQ